MILFGLIPSFERFFFTSMGLPNPDFSTIYPRQKEELMDRCLYFGYKDDYMCYAISASYIILIKYQLIGRNWNHGYLLMATFPINGRHLRWEGVDFP